MPLTIVRQDITTLSVDAIVNAANTELAMGGGVCGAIFQAAGPDKLQKACDKLAPIRTGEAAITPGFSLPCRYVIHAAGPVYQGQNPVQSQRLLCSAYTKALQLAEKNGCRSIAFPLISSGIYGYPKDQALQVATAAIQSFLSGHEMDIYLAVFDRDSFVISQNLLGDVACYIDEHYVAEHTHQRKLLQAERDAGVQVHHAKVSMEQFVPFAAMPDTAMGIEALVGNLDEPFGLTLLRLIDAKGKTDVEVYKRANLDRKLFSKIRTGKGYLPGKRTILALAVALELSLSETDDLLKRAGYALSHSQKFDVIVEYFILQKKYDINEINQVLFHYDQPLLGG